MVSICLLSFDGPWTAIAKFISPMFAGFVGVCFAAWFAIRKYHSEQRTSRLQKLYFEDALLGQTKVIEESMAQVNKNFLLTEYLVNLVRSLLDQDLKSREITKKYLEDIFRNISKNIEVKFNSTDFKKETISSLLYRCMEEKNSLSTWIKEFEEDSYRFSSFLQGQIAVLGFVISSPTGLSFLKLKESKE
ncbi:MAG: hypothetical protein A2X78_01080 [Gammaproteobacteria bacterium GWE2_37_16]|nr:MAG: hypothetical protein A2X78_01080 [Gammaproteobacteria bacterium GWE2_37_16]